MDAQALALLDAGREQQAQQREGTGICFAFISQAIGRAQGASTSASSNRSAGG